MLYTPRVDCLSYRQCLYRRSHCKDLQRVPFYGGSNLDTLYPELKTVLFSSTFSCKFEVTRDFEKQCNCIVLHCVVLCRVVSSVVLCCVVLYCVVLCRVVLCCAVLCYIVLIRHLHRIIFLHPDSFCPVNVQFYNIILVTSKNSRYKTSRYKFQHMESNFSQLTTI